MPGNAPYGESDENVCGEYPEHDYRLMDERDGFRTYVCRRCDAETFEEDGDDAAR